jgi:hypothetical protein
MGRPGSAPGPRPSRAADRGRYDADAATRRVSFAWTDLKDRPLDTASMLGRTTIIAFIATYDVTSQTEAQFLTAISRRDPVEKPRAHR